MGCSLGCGWVFGGGAVWGALRVTVQAHFCEIDGRVQGACCCRCCFGMLFGVLLEVRSSGGAVGGDGVQSLLSGVYAGVLVFSVDGSPRVHMWDWCVQPWVPSQRLHRKRWQSPTAGGRRVGNFCSTRLERVSFSAACTMMPRAFCEEKWCQ